VGRGSQGCVQAPDLQQGLLVRVFVYRLLHAPAPVMTFTCVMTVTGLVFTHAHHLPPRRSGCFPLSSYFGAVCIKDDGIKLRSRFLLAVCVRVRVLRVCVCVRLPLAYCRPLAARFVSALFCLTRYLCPLLARSPPSPPTSRPPHRPHPPLVLPRTTLHALPWPSSCTRANCRSCSWAVNM